MKPKLGTIAIAFFFIFLPFITEAFSVGDVERFFVEPTYDLKERKETKARLQRITNYIYFYVDKGWWEGLSEEKQKEYDEIIYNLGNEFEENIYYEFTSRFGDKPEHRVTSKERISVFFHPMQENAGGYFRSGDQYSRYQYSQSNERNILYLSSNVLSDPALPGYLSHEYAHLVTFNEKNRKQGINEEVWLNELRAEVIPTLLGYDDEYEESNLRLRVQNFLRDPDISLTEWTEQAADYGVINLFGQYLIDHYGEPVIKKSLKSEFIGIPSLDYALSEHEKRFSEIFTEWTIASYLNDCSLGEYYCYKNESLENLRVSPTTYFLPTKNEGGYSTEYRTKNWAGNWHRIVGGSGTLYLEFSGDKEFTVPYILCEKDGDCEVRRMEMDDENKGEIVVEGFNSKYESIILVPSLQQKFEGFNGPEQTHSFYWEAKIIDKDRLAEKEREKEAILKEVKERLVALREDVAKLYKLAGIKFPENEIYEVKKNLYFGMEDSREVRSLQRFLKSRGEDIYPEGFVTGNFYELTRKAVIRFQEKHRQEILEPLGLKSGTGYVGESTRNYINSLMKK